ncbi:Hypothetical protein Minf_2057 [Methylacidiphilum infernorum V4]|uniref:Uncharacterized protein n=1 Tax=Methylacidiphilum infernorum (isolate V4) TaxID=481448 RepID=B3DZ19_METI4|nr:Hypothetical protein Minf_2057 [Methylacidiphilum infernorum V4]
MLAFVFWHFKRGRKKPSFFQIPWPLEKTQGGSCSFPWYYPGIFKDLIFERLR